MTGTGRLLRMARDIQPAETDGDLLGRYARDRDEAAFAELVRRNGPVVLRACRSILGDAGAAEDAFQATFLVLSRKAARLAHPGSLAGWLHATAVRVARDARRAAFRATRREAARVAIRPVPADDLTWREVREVIDAELAALPEVYRVPLVLCYLQELSYEDAAARAGCSVGALRGRLERGKERLRKRLARYGLPAAAPVLVVGCPTPAPAALVEATLATVRAVAESGRVSAAVAALARPRMRLRVSLVSVVVGLAVVGVALAGAGLPAAGPPPPPTRDAADSPGPRVDRFGDPLPDGVLMRLGTIRARAAVASFGVAPDGSVVTASPAGEVHVWPLTGDRPAASTRLPVTVSQEFVPRPAVSPDGRFLVANRPGKTTTVWERGIAGCKEVASFDLPHPQNFQFSPDGDRFVAFSTGLHLLDLRTKTVVALDGGGRNYEAAAFSGDGTRLAATTGYETDLWDTRDGQRLARYKTVPVLYGGLALDRTGKVLAVNTWNPEGVVFVDPVTGGTVPGLSGPADFRGSWVSFAPDDRTVLLGDRSGVTWWDPVAGKQIRRFEGMAHSWSGGWNLPARFSPDGKVLVGTSTKMLLRWDAATGQPLRLDVHDAGHQSELRAVGISADGRWVATGGNDARVRVWDMQVGRSVASVPSTKMLSPSNVEVGADGRYVYAPSPAGGGVTKWEVATGRAALRFEFSPAAGRRRDLVAYRLSPDGRTVDAVTEPGTADGSILRARWDTESGKSVFEGPAGVSTLSFPRFSPDGRWVATARALFPLEVGPDGNRLPPGGTTLFDSGVFSVDGRLLAGAVRTQAENKLSWGVAVFEVSTGTKVVEIPTALSGWLTIRLAFHPDGRSVASAGMKGLTFYDLMTRQPFAERKALAGMDDPRTSFARVVRYFPDGTKLITGHADTTALIWEAPARPKAARPLDEKGQAAAWDDLAAADGAKGWAAVWALADDPGAVAFLRQRLRPVEPLAANEFGRLLTDLGSEVFATREAAEKELRQAGERAAGQLRSALTVARSAEQRVRLRRLVGGLPDPDARPTGERLRGVRAVAALETAGSADARRLLAELAAGAADTTTTREAEAALERVGR
ncbi:MAG TPA: sigma-70 family RNA polymerase sigma factor [Urbifossiella sp.]|nr:sigma-70 family RNA polymerase sigma factor [Urbifossiella sp.]